VGQNAWFEEWFAKSQADAEKAARRERFRARWFPTYEDVARRATVWTWRARMRIFVVALVLLALVAFMERTGLTDTGAGGIVAFLLAFGIFWCLSYAVAGSSSWDDDSPGDYSAGG
jgi:hypothetical protein